MRGAGRAEREAITAPGASKPAGPYSHAVRAGELLFISGQAPFDAEGKPVGTTFGERARAVFDNIARIAQAAGGDLADCVRIGAFIEDYANFAEYNDVMREYFTAPYPARTTIPVPTLGIAIEVDAVIALPPRPDSGNASR